MGRISKNDNLMKKNFAINIICFLHLTVIAQQKEFEGIIVKRVELRSKSDLISTRAIKNMLAIGDETTLFVKQGNYKLVTGAVIYYYISKDQRVYSKYPKIDTLYYFDYTFDSATIKKISKSDEKRTIAGFECKAITIEASDAVRKYFYAPALYLNPEYDKNNTLNKFNVYVKETSSIDLANTEETDLYFLSYTCSRLQQTTIADSVFDLPNLPKKKFSMSDLIKPPEFTRAGGWEKYLRTNLDAELGPKYIKIPKGEEKASETVYVKFLVNENGKVVKAIVENTNEVHSKLAQEALRVVNESPLWKPATIYNSNATSIFWFKIPITFQVTKK
jgi:hypothetical protein